MFYLNSLNKMTNFTKFNLSLLRMISVNLLANLEMSNSIHSIQVEMLQVMNKKRE